MGVDVLREAARERGGRCWAMEWRGAYEKYPFECSEGHGWDASAYNVLHGSWCPKCARIAKRGPTDPDGRLLKTLGERVAGKGWTLVSTEWLGGEALHEFVCSAGHAFEMKPSLARLGGVCVKCHGLPKRRVPNPFSEPPPGPKSL